MAVSRLIGERAVATEVPAYIHLSGMLRDGVITNPRSVIIATYALCGFAYVASLAIFVGGISSVASSRAGDLARVGGQGINRSHIGMSDDGLRCGPIPRHRDDPSWGGSGRRMLIEKVEEICWAGIPKQMIPQETSFGMVCANLYRGVRMEFDSDA